MRRPAFAAFVLTLLAPITPATAAPPDLVATTPPRTPDGERKAFHLPPGFVAELVAAEPEIHKPLNIAFDDRGRLWVTETLEYPFPAPEGKTPRDGVKILSDFGPDGRARKVETFADGLNIPIGLLPLPGGQSALVHSIPNVYKVSRNGKKEPLYQSYGFKDTHGMTNAFTWGFDGWVYACHGFSNESNVQGSDRKPIQMHSGNTYRMQADGTHAEYYSHGQVNPFGLAFDPLGNLYSCDCHTRPVYQLLRGAYYPGFGTPHDGLGYGPVMATHDHGSTGIAGIVYYAADHFPVAYRDTIFVGNVVTNRINHDRIEWHGSSPRAIEQPDFLASDDPWFRPVDIELGPDGALYVADFYNRIIGHYEVPLTHPGRDHERGRIWRIVYRGVDGKGRVDPPGGYTTIFPMYKPTPVRQLFYELHSPNLAVRTRAANRLLAEDRLGPRGMDGLIRESGLPRFRVQALWVGHRAGKLSDETLADALDDGDRLVRVHAMKVLGERPELSGALAEAARKALKDQDPFVRRAAAETLGRHPDTARIVPLLALLQSSPADDTHLIHVTRMALREQFRDDRAWEWVEPKVLSEKALSAIAGIAPGVPSAASARFLFGYIREHPGERRSLAGNIQHIARHGEPGDQADLLAFVRGRREPGGLLRRAELLRAFHQGLQERGTPPGDDARKYALALTGQLLDAKEANEVLAGINLAASFRLGGASPKLKTLALDETTPEPFRLESLSAITTIDPKGAAPVLGRVLTDPARPVSLRDRAAALLAATSQPEAQAALLSALPTVPERTQTAIAVGLAARRPGAEALLDAVAAGKASARLLQENRVAALLAGAGVADLPARLETLLRGLPPADQKINALIAARRDGYAKRKVDAADGSKVFETHCANCHQLAGKGAKVGPQLDGVGLRGLDRVTEDVLDPSRNVDQAFRLTSLALDDGRVVSGLLLREEGETLVLADSQGKEVRVPKRSVEERTVSQLSPMPANFAEQITEPDFYRLVAYLLSQKPAE